MNPHLVLWCIGGLVMAFMLLGALVFHRDWKKSA